MWLWLGQADMRTPEVNLFPKLMIWTQAPEPLYVVSQKCGLPGIWKSEAEQCAGVAVLHIKPLPAMLASHIRQLFRVLRALILIQLLCNVCEKH